MTRFDDLLTEAFDEIADRAVPSPSARERLHARVVEDHQHRPEEVVVMLAPADHPDPRPRWLIPAAIATAATVAVALAAALFVRSGTDDVATITDTVATPENTATTEPAIGNWRPVLAGITASDAPAVADCPSGTPSDARLALPEYLQYSETGWPLSRVSAAYDSAAHSVIVFGVQAHYWDPETEGVSTVAGRFDVCSGTWAPMNADLTAQASTYPSLPYPILPLSLVYDVDSGVLVAFTTDGVRVYDPATDEWIDRPDNEPLLDPVGEPVSMTAMTQPVYPWQATARAVYHPASGMIIVADDWIAAYDVDDAEWHWIGYESDGDFFGDFIGLNSELNGFVFDGWTRTDRGLQHVTRLMDPVTGEAIDVPVRDRGHVDLRPGREALESFGQADGTVFLTNRYDATLCGFDATTFKRSNSNPWVRCVDLPNGHQWTVPGLVIIGDPQNDGLIAISGPEIWTAPIPEPNTTPTG